MTDGDELSLHAAVRACAASIGRVEGTVDGIATSMVAQREATQSAHARITEVATDVSAINAKVDAAIQDGRDTREDMPKGVMTWASFGKVLTGFVAICGIIGGGIWALTTAIGHAINGGA